MFVLLAVAAYTANMAAHLTVTRLDLPITSAKELADNSQGIQYGAYRGGTSFMFFKVRDLQIIDLIFTIWVSLFHPCLGTLKHFQSFYFSGLSN